MYGWIWRHLPGSLGVRLLTALVLVAGAGTVLWYAVFPLLEPAVTLDEVTVRK
ncbi:hypothetical protein [Nonomuraea dietziae]|uniref:Uncharacterized protein n=1 Tax=Nonomuraea dietziae TaxID=65515 RepID=A0A7W5VDL8_9ACTN|nr:hypothetical protein [Nonomuraea dietziae]